mgnify:FL=1|tara:strand:+ start:711 stop:1523 length:813 start_codon:yes stop_codon:yes gene_type:complete
MNNWKKYNGAIIPTLPPHIDIKETIDDILSFLIKSNAYFARWTTNFDCSEETEFWYVIKDTFEGLDELSRNTRKSIRKGLKNVSLQKVSKQYIITHGYNVYQKAFSKYNTYLPIKSHKQFVKELESDIGVWDFWGVFNTEKILVGYSKNRILNDVCDYYSTKFDPDYLKSRMSDALFYKMTEYYLGERDFKYVSGGTRSISHDTNIQKEYVKKFKFRKAYCHLHVIYNSKINLLVRCLYPFIGLLRLFSFGPFRQLNILLKQESIRRSFE